METGSWPQTSDRPKVKAGRLSLRGLHLPVPSGHSGRVGLQLTQAWGASSFRGDPSLLLKVLIGEISARLRGEGLEGRCSEDPPEEVPGGCAFQGALTLSTPLLAEIL